ncbi:MAG: hypothetical protein QM729_09560 [Solirubrobacterales bacterium]
MLYSIDTCSLIEVFRQFPPEFVRTLWPSRDPTNNPKIPDVGAHYRITCIDVRDLTREEGWDW